MQNTKNVSFLKNADIFSASSLLCFFIYKILLDVSYITILIPMYGYAGFVLEYSPVSIAVGFLMTACVYICMPKKMKTVSDFILTGIAFLAIVPYISYYSFGGGSFEFTAMSFLMFVAVVAFVRLTPDITFPCFSQKTADVIFTVILWGSIAYVFITCISAMGLSSISLDFSTVYERRAAFKSSGVAGSYLMTWSGNAIFPCSIAYFLYRKKYLNVLAAACSAGFIFAVSGMKSILFGSIMVFAVYILLHVKQKMSIIAFLFVLAVFVTMVCFYVFEEIIPFSYVVRRLAYIPAKVSNQHFDFFKQEGPIQLGNSIFSSVIPYPYESDPADIIGSLYYISGETHANSGVFADGFTNFGYFGAFLWTVIFAFMMKLQDIVSVDKPIYVTAGCFALYITIFTNSALFTSIMTHGFLVALILVAIIPKSVKAKKEEVSKTDEKACLCDDECSSCG